MSDDDNKIIYFPRKGPDDEMSIDDILRELADEEEEELDIEEYGDVVEDEDDDSPIIQFVNQVLHEAIAGQADSIHFECHKDTCTWRFEKGRVLSSARPIQQSVYRAISARLKILFYGDITERRLPQMGSFSIRLEDGEAFHKFYAFTVPTIFGENITLKTTHGDIAPAFELSTSTKQRLNTVLERRQGLVVLSSYDFRYFSKGYYAVMDFLADPGRRVMNIDKNSIKETLEKVPHVTHVSYTPGILSFESALQSAVRVEPNIIMVHNIDIANIPAIVNAASFASDILFVVSLKAFDVVASMNAIMSCGIDVKKIRILKPLLFHYIAYSQNCPRCSAGVALSERDTLWLKGKAMHNRAVTLKIGQGCESCLGTGISGQLLQEAIVSLDGDTWDTLKSGPDNGFADLLKDKIQRHPNDRDILKGFLTGHLSYRDFNAFTLRA